MPSRGPAVLVPSLSDITVSPDRVNRNPRLGFFGSWLNLRPIFSQHSRTDGITPSELRRLAGQDADPKARIVSGKFGGISGDVQSASQWPRPTARHVIPGGSGRG